MSKGNGHLIKASLPGGMRNPKLLHDLIGIYLRGTSTRLREMQLAIKTRKSKELRMAAHAVRGSSLNLNLGQMASLCEQMEMLAQSRSTAGAAVLFNNLTQEYDRVRQALKKQRQKTGRNGAKPIH